MTPEARDAARAALPHARALLGVLTKFVTEFSTTFSGDRKMIVDYRIDESYVDAQRIVRLLTYLDTGDDPAFNAALAEFRTRFGVGDDTNDTPPTTA